MADFYPVLSRAVARLEDNTEEARRELFERARTIAVAQLRRQDPSKSAREIEHELAALETAIRRVELESRAHPAPEPTRPAQARATVNRSSAVNDRKDATPRGSAATTRQESAPPANTLPQDTGIGTDGPQAISATNEMTAMAKSLGTMLAGIAFTVGAMTLIGVVYVRGLVLVENGVIDYSVLLAEVVILLGLFIALPFAVFRNPRIASAIDYLVKLIYSALRRSLEFSR